MSLNFKLILAYDGTNYKGWQKTESGPSIEQALQDALEQILREKIVLQAASRTDAGVHSQGQVVNFFTAKENVNLGKLQIGLNALLPKDIAVLSVEKVLGDFHPTLNCQAKEYHYHLCYGPAQLPQRRFYSWHYPHILDQTLMRQGAQLLTGRHNFETFCNFKKSCHYESFVREVFCIEILDVPENQLCFKIRGNHFLYKMVRNIVGTLVYLGNGKIALEDLSHILGSRDRTRAGVTAPAHGLCLFKIDYSQKS